MNTSSIIQSSPQVEREASTIPVQGPIVPGGSINNFRTSKPEPQTDADLIAKARGIIQQEATKQPPITRIEELCKNS